MAKLQNIFSVREQNILIIGVVLEQQGKEKISQGIYQGVVHCQPWKADHTRTPELWMLIPLLYYQCCKKIQSNKYTICSSSSLEYMFYGGEAKLSGFKLRAGGIAGNIKFRVAQYCHWSRILWVRNVGNKKRILMGEKLYPSELTLNELNCLLQIC